MALLIQLTLVPGRKMMDAFSPQQMVTYGTGSNGFFQSPDASQTWIVYHATEYSSGACNDSRYTMVELLETHSDGSPNFGSPVAWTHAYSEPSGE